MRNLDFTSDSPQSIKLGDSNSTLSLRVTELDQPVDLAKASSITVKIGNMAGFITEINVDVSSLLHPTDGRIDAVIDSKISSKLPAGWYLLEVWIKDAQGNTAIYPDTSYPSVIGFSIKKNIMEATSTVITTLTLADFETKFDDIQKDLQEKVTSGYFKGDPGDQGLSAYQVAVNAGFSGSVNQWLASLVGAKGDTGTVDNTGLINAPAFQSLQNQVDNSAVGTNLLKNTGDLSANWISGRGVTVDTSQKPVVLHYPTTTITSSMSSIIASQELNDGLLQSYTTYTASFYAKGTGTFVFYCYANVSNGTFSDTRTNIKLTSDYKRYTITFTTVPNISGNKSFCLRQDYSPSATDQNTVEAYVYGFKLEKGSVATDWCPNPSEILTQSDYAKIKAAIVALGGTLS